MKTQQVELFIQASKYTWEENFVIEVNQHNHVTDKTSIYIPLGKVIVNVEVPELDEKTLTLAHIEQIQGQIKLKKPLHISG